MTNETVQQSVSLSVTKAKNDIIDETLINMTLLLTQSMHAHLTVSVKSAILLLL